MRKYDDNFVDDVLEFIENNLHLNLNEIAKHFNIEPGRLKSILKYRKNFILTYYKWEKAYDMYKAGFEYHVIAKKLGYYSVPHVNYAVKKYCEKNGLDYEKERRTKNRINGYKTKPWFKKICEKCNFSYKCVFKKTGLGYYQIRKKLYEFNLFDWFHNNAIKLYPNRYTKGEKTKMAIEYIKEYPLVSPNKIAKLLEMDVSYCYELKEKIEKGLL